MLIIKKANYLLGIINLWFINVWFYLCFGFACKYTTNYWIIAHQHYFFCADVQNNPVVSTRSRKPYFLLVIG